MIKQLCAAIGLMATLSCVAEVNIEYYRYTDSKGNLVIDRSIPSEFVAKGYDVIDEHGELVRQVPRALTPEERAVKDARDAAQNELEAIEKAQRDYDIMLLRKYSFVSDIKSEQKRKVNELKVRLSILKGNLKSLRSEIEAEYEKAARIEQRGGNAEPIESRIQQLENKIISTEATLVKHQEGVAELNQEYEQAIQRFKEIANLRQRHQGVQP